MTRGARTAACVFVFGSLLSGQQHVTIQPTLGIAEQEYREAQQAWLHADPDLAADLMTGNPAALHQRIASVRKLRMDVMDKKVVYLDLIVKRFGDLRAKLTTTDHAELPVPELRKALQEQQSMLLADQDRLEALIRDSPQGDENALVLRELNNEKTQLVKLQNSVAMRLRSIDQLDQSQQSIRNLEKDPVDQNLERIAALWTEERDAAKAQRAHFDALYKAMDDMVDRGRGAVKERPASRPAATPSAPAARPQGSLKTAPFSGVWAYQSQPGAWTGFGEPVHASLDLTYTYGHVAGTYTARLPGRSGYRELRLKLTGEEVSPGTAKVEWSSDVPPGQGEMVLRLGGDRRLLLERTFSDDTYFPRGMEVLLPR